MKEIAVRQFHRVVAVVFLTVTTLADVPSPDTSRSAEANGPFNIAAGIGFALAGAALFIWLGRRDSKR